MFAISRPRLRSHVLSRIAVAGAIASAGVLLSAIPALAHVTVSPDSAQAGSTAVLTFHVPNEEAKAYTTRVDMQLPTDHPIAQLLVKPVPGWTISVRTITLAKPLVTDDGQFTQAVAEVTWSGGRIAPGQFQDFSLSADPLPQGVSQLAFKTVQTYSNGDVVRWIDLPQPGQPEPDHPAPILTLTAGTAAAAAARPAAAVTSSPGGSDGMARGIAAAGVAVGLLGLALGGVSWRRSKAVAAMAFPGPSLNGQDAAAASAAKPVPEPRRAGTPARNAPKRKGASGRRGPNRR